MPPRTWIVALALVAFGAAGRVGAHGAGEGHGDAAAAGQHGRAADCEGTPLHCASAATPLLAPDGRLLLAWTSQGAVYFAASKDLGRSFADPVVLDRRGRRLDGGSDARPSLAMDSRGRIAVAYAYFKDDVWNAEVMLVRSDDGGRHFSPPRALAPGDGSQRFASLLSAPDGRLFATWIDKAPAPSADAAAASAGERSVAVAYAWSDDGGASFGAPTRTPGASCECCRIALASDPAGCPTLAYRAVFDGRTRDTALVRACAMTGGTPTLAQVARDDWKTDTCPHHGPAVAVDAGGRVHVAWFTQGERRQGLFYAHDAAAPAGDAAPAFSPPLPVGDASSHAGRPALASSGRRVWLAWKEFDGRTSAVQVMQSDDGGDTWSAPRRVATTSGYADHPLLVAAGARIYLSWLTRDDGYVFAEITGP